MHVVSIFSGPRFGAGSPNRAANMTGSIRWPRRIGSIPWPKRPTDGSSHMYTMNQLTLIGFTGQDAEIHYTQNGTLVTTLSVATKESWKNAEGAWQSRSEWHRVVLMWN